MSWFSKDVPQSEIPNESYKQVVVSNEVVQMGTYENKNPKQPNYTNHPELDWHKQVTNPIGVYSTDHKTRK